MVSLMVCGHIHEARGIKEENGTIVVNPGMAAAGFAALIDIDTDDPAEGPRIDVRLIKA
jgi:Icc-related predicted phosphoesterase